MLAAGAASSWLRWLRVAQREHYLGGSVSRFALRWWTSSRASIALGLLAIAGIAGSVAVPPVAVVTAMALVVGPLGLGVRGRTSPLAWTRRLTSLAALSGAMLAGLGVAAASTPWPFAAGALVVVLSGVVVDTATVILSPIEDHLAMPYVERARRRLSEVGPSVVAITGSYGKTSTKHHLAELLAGTTSVVPTPRSFNNRAGLAIAVNDHLAEGTRVFIAEMGTYRTGEIRAMCDWCRPEVSVLTAIGPVHLERFRTLERIAAAKAEIAERARVVVCNVDDERLRVLAGSLASDAREVLTAGSVSADADVRVEVVGERWRVVVRGETVLVTNPIPGVQPTNLACAIAAGVALGVDAHAIATRIPHVAPVAHRLTVASAPSGVLVVDDTYNANPAGAGAALDLLRSLPVDGRRVVVTPGMIELGTRQRTENEAFAGAAAQFAAAIVVIGRTNVSALRRGAVDGGADVVRVTTREHAVEWVRSTLGRGDAVLYENDLPDHYP
ncbi:MAG TPA: Mur ligase family protein [Acidimicrobiales bacterium]|nr:Mur ligase family protein [Acidimicrobiales bacterium]